jgi:hypothetical protein
MDVAVEREVTVGVGYFSNLAAKGFSFPVVTDEAASPTDNFDDVAGTMESTLLNHFEVVVDLHETADTWTFPVDSFKLNFWEQLCFEEIEREEDVEDKKLFEAKYFG